MGAEGVEGLSNKGKKKDQRHGGRCVWRWERVWGDK